MLPQTNTIKNMEMIVQFSEAAPHRITFEMKLKAKPPSALLRNVEKVRVERSTTVKFVNSEVLIHIV